MVLLYGGSLWITEKGKWGVDGIFFIVNSTCGTCLSLDNFHKLLKFSDTERYCVELISNFSKNHRSCLNTLPRGISSNISLITQSR